MKAIFLISPLMFVTAVTCSFAQDTGSPAEGKVLFVSDKTDKPAAFFMDAFTEELTDAGYDFTGTAVDAASRVDLDAYTDVLVYSQVMAFNNLSPVSAWVKAQKSLQGKRLFLFVTANRWFFGSRLAKLKMLVKARGGDVVDAVTMATNRMSAEQKRAAVDKLVDRIR